jgi:two-component sensor histidine kinase
MIREEIIWHWKQYEGDRIFLSLGRAVDRTDARFIGESTAMGERARTSRHWEARSMRPEVRRLRHQEPPSPDLPRDEQVEGIMRPGPPGSSIEELRAEMRYRDLLVQEIIHRTKNILQAAVSIIGSEAESSEGGTRVMLLVVERALCDLAQAHEYLFSSRLTGRADLQLRIQRLCESIHRVFGRDSERIAISVEAQDIALESEQLFCMGLVIQELVTNVFKHAFAGRESGRIRIKVFVTGRSICRVMVCDDGAGIRSAVGTGSSGLRLMDGLVARLCGQIRSKSRNGTCVRVAFPISLPEGDCAEGPSHGSEPGALERAALELNRIGQGHGRADRHGNEQQASATTIKG